MSQFLERLFRFVRSLFSAPTGQTAEIATDTSGPATAAGEGQAAGVESPAGEPALPPESQLAAIAMTLSAIAYADPKDIGNQLANPRYATGGWDLVWGPGEKEGNLQYLAKSRDGRLYGLAIRGSLFDFSLAFLENWYDDLDVLHQSAFSSFGRGAMVSQGTALGLDHLTTLQAGGWDLLQAVQKYVLPSGAPLIVTGHSLGAALATALPGLLWNRLGGTNVLEFLPYTFAAPAIGNAKFAAAFEETFPKARRYWNDQDIVPRAWADVPSMKALYEPPGPSCPVEIKGVIDLTQAALRLAEGWDESYYTPVNGPGSRLRGDVQPTDSWFTEAEHQHDHNTYLSLLKAPPVRLGG